MRKIEKKIIEIKEDVKIGNIILESGDKIQILEYNAEAERQVINRFNIESLKPDDFIDVWEGKVRGTIRKIIIRHRPRSWSKYRVGKSLILSTHIGYDQTPLDFMDPAVAIEIGVKISDFPEYEKYSSYIYTD